MNRGLIFTMPLVATAFLVTLAGSITSASAYDRWYDGRGVGYGGGYGYGGYGAQTAASANMTGMGNMMQGAGQYNMMTSEAAINYEQARSAAIDNQQKIYYALQDRKKITQADQAKSDQAARDERARAQAFSAANQPPPLSPRQLDYKTGLINWPPALTAAIFADHRNAIQEQFQKLSKYGADASVSTIIDRKVGEMKDLLRSQITEIPMPDYSESRRFLDSVAASGR